MHGPSRGRDGRLRRAACQAGHLRGSLRVTGRLHAIAGQKGRPTATRNWVPNRGLAIKRRVSPPTYLIRGLCRNSGLPHSRRIRIPEAAVSHRMATVRVLLAVNLSCCTKRGAATPVLSGGRAAQDGGRILRSRLLPFRSTIVSQNRTAGPSKRYSHLLHFVSSLS